MNDTPNTSPERDPFSELNDLEALAEAPRFTWVPDAGEDLSSVEEPAADEHSIPNYVEVPDEEAG